MCSNFLDGLICNDGIFVLKIVMYGSDIMELFDDFGVRGGGFKLCR